MLFITAAAAVAGLTHCRPIDVVVNYGNDAAIALAARARHLPGNEDFKEFVSDIKTSISRRINSDRNCWNSKINRLDLVIIAHPLPSDTDAYRMSDVRLYNMLSAKPLRLTYCENLSDVSRSTRGDAPTTRRRQLVAVWSERAAIQLYMRLHGKALPTQLGIQPVPWRDWNEIGLAFQTHELNSGIIVKQSREKTIENKYPDIFWLFREQRITSNFASDAQGQNRELLGVRFMVTAVQSKITTTVISGLNQCINLPNRN